MLSLVAGPELEAAALLLLSGLELANEALYPSGGKLANVVFVTLE